MNKNSIFSYFRGALLVIAMFNLLQAESKKNANPYGLTSPFDRIGHQQDMEKFGSEIMDKGDQKAVRQVLRNMGVENAEKVPLKKLFNNKLVDGVTTSTGIWISPHLPKERADYVRHQEAKTYWEKNKKTHREKQGDNSELLPYWFMSSLMGIAFFAYASVDTILIERQTQTIMMGSTAFCSVLFEIADWQSRNNQEKIKEKQRKVLRDHSYQDLAEGV